MAVNERVEGPVVTRRNATRTLTCQPELGVGFNCRYNLTEHGRGDDMDLVKKNEAPFTGLQEIHHLLRIMSSRALVRNHRVRGNNDAAFACELQNLHQSICSREMGEGRLTRSFCSAVKTHICLSVTFVHCMNCWRHCITDTDDVQSTRQDFLMVHAAVMPTRVFPAPQGSTIMPERARLDSANE